LGGLEIGDRLDFGWIADWGQAGLGRWACSAGPVLRAQGSSGEVWIFRAVREGERVIASSACSGPVPLPLGNVRGDFADFWGQAGLWMDCGLGTGWFGSVGAAPRDRSCARREARGRYGLFALCAKGRG
jgi:hypothetical protein